MTLKNDESSLFLQQLDLRTAQFRRNEALEKLLDELTAYLAPLEATLEDGFLKPAQPPLFLVGNPRSGTSLFMQFLAFTQGFSVPTNLLSRFYYAPFLGAKIQELLTNPAYDFKDELRAGDFSLSLESDMGKAKGMLAPSEFFHFWRRFLPRYDPQYLNEPDQQKVDLVGLQKGIAAIEAVLGKPFAAKAIIMQYNLDLLFAGFPDAIFFYMRRDPLFIMQSILQARERFYGSKEIWWSVKPQEYEDLKGMDVYHQIAGQVYYTDRAIAKALQHLPAANQMSVDYEAFCAKPRQVAEMLVARYAEKGFAINIQIQGFASLESRNEIRIAPEEARHLESAYADFVNSTIP